jgi:predicted aspartyl protease
MAVRSTEDMRFVNSTSIRLVRMVCVRVILVLCAAASPRATDLETLYKEHRWFELRDAINGTAPAFYRGAVACVFNDSSHCEKTLRSVIEDAPRSKEAAESRGLLLSVYQRAGRFRRAVAEIDRLLATDPDNTSLKNARALFGTLARYPDQSIFRRQHSTIRYRLKAGNLFVPVSIRGRSRHYIVDTGADFSVMSESEARRLGLTIHQGGARVTDITGETMGARTAEADELQIGETRLRHVAFLVVGDDQQPFVDLAPDERAVLGLPVLLALDAFRWTADGAFELAFRPQRENSQGPNMCFDGATPVTQASVKNRHISLHVDTGATETLLWPHFANDFATVLSESGVPGTKRVTGVGHSVDVQSIDIPELMLQIGGIETVLRPAHVLVDDARVAGKRDHGNLGLDLLSQARTTTFDFRSMTLVLK